MGVGMGGGVKAVERGEEGGEEGEEMPNSKDLLKIRQKKKVNKFLHRVHDFCMKENLIVSE